MVTVCTGINHKFNVLKFRIMETLYMARPYALTCKEIAKTLGIHEIRVQGAMSYYTRYNYPYFHRLKKKAPYGSYRYALRKEGKKAYAKYLLRIKLGFDLNQNSPVPQKMPTFTGLKVIRFRTKEDLYLAPEQLEPYFSVTKYGSLTLGLTKNDLLKVAGLIKETEAEECLSD